LLKNLNQKLPYSPTNTAHLTSSLHKSRFFPERTPQQKQARIVLVESASQTKASQVKAAQRKRLRSWIDDGESKKAR
jgi:hypothetical protein